MELEQKLVSQSNLPKAFRPYCDAAVNDSKKVPVNDEGSKYEGVKAPTLLNVMKNKYIWQIIDNAGL